MTRAGVMRVVGAAALITVIGGCGQAAPAPRPPSVPPYGALPGTAAPVSAVSAPAPAASSAPAPAASSEPALPAAALALANRTHEVASAGRARVSVAGYWSTPAGAIAAFASAYVDWNAADVVDKLRALAAVSVGPARSEMQMAQARAAGDPSLRREAVADAGVVEAVTPVAHRAGLWLVVTRELMSSHSGGPYAGAGEAWHVTLARAARVARGEWVVSAWQPES